MLKKRFIVFNKGFSTEDTLSLFFDVSYFVIFSEWHATSFLNKTFSTGSFGTEFSSSESKIYPLQDPLFFNKFFSFVLTLQSLLFNAHYRQCFDSQSHYILDRFKKCRKEVLEYFVFNNMYVSLNERWIWKNWHNFTRPCFSYSTF